MSSSIKMEPLLEELEAVAEKLGVKVSYESLQETVGGGGLCRVKGQARIIIDRRATAGERVGTVARALATFDLDGIFLSPRVREIVEQQQRLLAARGSSTLASA
jgi:hypothetical protein